MYVFRINISFWVEVCVRHHCSPTWQSHGQTVQVRNSMMQLGWAAYIELPHRIDKCNISFCKPARSILLNLFFYRFSMISAWHNQAIITFEYLTHIANSQKKVYFLVTLWSIHCDSSPLQLVATQLKQSIPHMSRGVPSKRIFEPCDSG